MDKVRVNNQVVSMRKIVKQSKVHAVNKLVKDINMLQRKKGSDQQLAKYKRKEERFVEEINIIKKLNVDEVSQNVLMQLKDWNSLISDKTISVKERAFARVAGFAPLQAQVQKFIGENPKLKNLLPDFFEEWKSKKTNPLHQEAKKLKASELKFKRKQKLAKLKEKLINDFQLKHNLKPKDKLNNTKIQVIKTETAITPQSNDQTSNEVKKKTPEVINACSENIDETVDQINEEFFKITDIPNENNESEEENDNSSEDENDFENNLSESRNTSEESKVYYKDNLNNTNSKVLPKSRIMNEIAVLKLDELKDEEIQGSEKSDSDGESDEQTSGGTTVTKDPFFMLPNESFDEDSSSNVISMLEEQNPTEGYKNKQNNFRKFSKNKPFMKHDFKGNRRNSTNNFSQQKPFQKSFNSDRQRQSSTQTRFSSKAQHRSPKFSNDKKWNSKPTFPNKVRTDSSSNKGNKNVIKKETGLHPSWEAKKKLKEQTSKLLPFQGKKIKFE